MILSPFSTLCSEMYLKNHSCNLQAHFTGDYPAESIFQIRSNYEMELAEIAMHLFAEYFYLQKMAFLVNYEKHILRTFQVITTAIHVSCKHRFGLVAYVIKKLRLLLETKFYPRFHSNKRIPSFTQSHVTYVKRTLLLQA